MLKICDSSVPDIATRSKALPKNKRMAIVSVNFLTPSKDVSSVESCGVAPLWTYVDGVDVCRFKCSDSVQQVGTFAFASCGIAVRERDSTIKPCNLDT